MRILFATTHKHLPELRGGMEVNTHELAIALCRRKIAVGVVCGLAGIGWTGFAARLRMKALGNPAPKDTGLGYPVWRCWNSVANLERVARVFRPDVIVVQGGADFAPLVTAALKLGLPVFCYLHTPDRLLLDPAVLANPHLHFLTNSFFTASLHPEKRISAVIRPLMRREDYETETDRSAVVFVNPAPHKGLVVALALAAARPDLQFLFVVNRAGMMIGAAGEFNAEKYPNVRVVGPFKNMRDIYRHASIVLAPSQWLETWGRIATEAHFSGIPVLASDRGGLAEAVGDGGVCLAADAPQAQWIAALADIIDDPQHYQRLSLAARKYAARRETDCDFIVDSFVKALHDGMLHKPAPAASGTA